MYTDDNYETTAEAKAPPRISEPLPHHIIWRIENKSDQAVTIPFVSPLSGSQFVQECADYTIKAGYSGCTPEIVNLFFRSHIAKGWIRIFVEADNDHSDIEDFLDRVDFTTALPSGHMRQYVLPVQKKKNAVQTCVADFDGEAILDCISTWSLKFKRPCTCTIFFEHQSSFGSRLSKDLNLYVDSLKPKWWQFIKRAQYKRAVNKINDLFKPEPSQSRGR